MTTTVEYRAKSLAASVLSAGKDSWNVHQTPKIIKIVLNTSVASSTDIKQSLADAVNDLSIITGQKPLVTTAKKSIANYKIRKGQEIGAKVTLRGKRMYEFLDRLLGAALPKIRDFRGVPSNSFDKQGNYTLGVADQSIFPEIELEKIKRSVGFDITIVTTAADSDAAYEFLKLLGFPFKKRK